MFILEKRELRGELVSLLKYLEGCHLEEDRRLFQLEEDGENL